MRTYHLALLLLLMSLMVPYHTSRLHVPALLVWMDSSRYITVFEEYLCLLRTCIYYIPYTCHTPLRFVYWFHVSSFLYHNSTAAPCSERVPPSAPAVAAVTTFLTRAPRLPAAAPRFTTVNACHSLTP